jgi:Phage phiEco32-like COOH.NH2 ligase-type 2
MKASPTFMIGADPEIFVGDRMGVKSIIGRIGGTKQDPRPLPIGEGFAVQEDGVALEFNIPACGNKAAFVRAIADATGWLEQAMMDMHGFTFDKRSAISFPARELEDPRAHIFGCDPDYNAWSLQRNPRPKTDDRNLRSCGGHIHIGTDLDPIKVVRAMDVFAGVPSVLMDDGELRKQLYGKAGAFRQTSYGVEYRTLSNYWVFQERYCEWAYDAVAKALAAVTVGTSFDEDKEAILEAIDGNNRDVAARIVEKYALEVVL